MKNNIKIQSAAVIITALFTANVHSQRMYFNAGGGYGLSAAPTNIYLFFDNMLNYDYSSTNTTTYDGTTWSYSYAHTNKRIKGNGSFGKGIQAGGTFGYMFTEHIGAELGIGNLLGAGITSKNNYTSEYIDLTNSANNTTNTSSSEETATGKMLRFIPALKITAGNGKAKPYMRTGLVIGVGAKVIDAIKPISPPTGGAFAVEAEYSGGIALGFSGGLGVDFKLSSHFGIFAEGGIITQRWAPKKAELTKYTIDGIDYLPTLTTDEKETEFVDSYTSGSYNSSLPTKQLKIFLPFSSAGINVGVHFSFGGKKESAETK